MRENRYVYIYLLIFESPRYTHSLFYYFHFTLSVAELRELSARLITAASMGDMITCTSIIERYGIGLLNTGDYDGRTP